MLDIRRRNEIRNLAVIAHVDHGKTTLVDGMLRQSGLLRDSAAITERVLDSVDLERERGITILAKNTSVIFRSTRINILDTPGHHDFGGEVERMLMMADGVLLLVDAAEGPLPQTRFVMQKALAQGLPAIVAINKIDRQDARPAEVLDAVYELFIELGATDEQIEFPVLYTNGRAGIARRTLDDDSADLRPLFETILLSIPAPADRREAPLRLHVNNLGWDDYVGRLIIGRLDGGTIRRGESVVVLGEGGQVRTARVMRLYGFTGLQREEIEEAGAGDIVAVAGIEQVTIGDTLAADAETEPLPRMQIDEPTLAMDFCVNTSPLAGESGKYVTSRNLRDRLLREDRANVAIHVQETGSADVFHVIGRGELQLAILAETLRREGYELMLSRPEVVQRTIDGELSEPTERLVIDCPQSMVGAVTERLGPRKAQLLDIAPAGSRTRLEFRIPTRGLIGFHSEFLTLTRGTGVLHSVFDGWIPWQGPMAGRAPGAIVADRAGRATPYALYHLQPRGTLFIGPGTQVYEGMVIGENPAGRDIDVNVTREKKLTNMRAANKDENVILTPPRRLTLEQSIEFIADDELVEVTPDAIRLRKRVLSSGQRLKRAGVELRRAQKGRP